MCRKFASNPGSATPCYRKLTTLPDSLVSPNYPKLKVGTYELCYRSFWTANRLIYIINTLWNAIKCVRVEKLRRHKPCMNSNNLLTTVFKKRQCARRKRGYCPTTYMMFDAMIALLSFPRFCSHKPNSSCSNITTTLVASRCVSKHYTLLGSHVSYKHCNTTRNSKYRETPYISSHHHTGITIHAITFITVTKNLFSSSSCIAPLIDPIAQHNYKIHSFFCSQKLFIYNKTTYFPSNNFYYSASNATSHSDWDQLL